VDVIGGGVRIQIVDKGGNTMFPLGSAEPTPKGQGGPGTHIRKT